ncbi:MAG TPA: rhomboid family intramembrane serine protease [Chitinophagaceae bacterium]|nr:rhomboid family intramembrane serine protease [Chitinophagaceae bacterium]
MADRFESSISLEGLTTQQFLNLAAHAFNELEWPYAFTGEDSIAAQTGASGSSWGEEVSVTVAGDTATVVSKCTQKQLIDWGKNKTNVTLLGAAIAANRTRLMPEQLDEVPPNPHTGAAEANAFKERYESGTLTATDKLAIGFGGYYVTYTLIGINVLVFIIMIASGVHIMNPSGEDILDWGGNMRQYTASGEWWRLITSTFIHIGVLHLAMNMYALYSLGLYLEPVMGRWKFLAAYLATGVLASTTSLWWSGERVSAGASGAIFGIAGVWLALLLTNYVGRKVRQAMLQSMMIYVAFNLIYGLKGNIDNSAHIGGLVSGLVFGGLFFVMQKKQLQVKLFPAIVLAAAAIISVAVLNNFKDDSFMFSQAWDKVAALDEKALQPLSQDGLSKEDLIKKVETVTIPTCREMQDVMERTRSYKLGGKAKVQRDLLHQYVDVRASMMQAWLEMEKAATMDTVRMHDLSQKMQSIVMKLKASQTQ